VASVVQSSPARPPAESPVAGRNLKFIIAGGVIALAVAYLVLMGVQGATVYFLTVGELQAKGPAAQNQLFRVSGNLVPGTLARDANGVGIHFLIADAVASPASTPLPVVYHGGQVPDIIGDNIEIVAEGRLDAQGTFTANNVLAKCPSRLENAPPEEHDY
jgi:cytochrome c-type biogenesis protein CcmE